MNIKEFIGLTFKNIIKSDNNEVLTFETIDGRKFKMYHEQDCCETVYLNDVAGDFEFLIDTPILNASESSNKSENSDSSVTWTFYHMNTIKGYVTLRWYGESSGYCYSEDVCIEEIYDIETNINSKW